MTMPDPNPTPFGHEGQDKDLRLQDLWHTLLRNRWLVLAVTIATVALAGLVTWRQDPVYQTEATLWIDDKGGKASMLGELAPMLGGDQGKLETEMVVLRSRQIAEPVVDSLGLHVVLEEPAARRDKVIRLLEAPRDAFVAAYELEREEGGTYTVTVDGGRSPEGLPQRVRAGEPFELGGVRLELRQARGGTPPERIRLRVRPFRKVVSEFRGEVDVSRQDLDAQIVTVGYRSTDPGWAAAVPNSLMGSFMRYKARTSKSESQSAVVFLREQVAYYEAQLNAAEDRVQAFRERQQVVNLADQGLQQVQRLAEMQARRDEMRAERDALAELLGRVERGQGESARYRQLASFPVFLANRAVQDILQALTQLENQRAELLTRRTEENVDVRGVQGRIEELEEQLHQTARNYLQSLDTQIASLDATLARFGSQLETVPAREIQFARLGRQKDLLEEVYTLLHTRLKEAEIQQAMVPGDVRVIDDALVPEEPVSPRPMRNLVLATLLGIAFGVGIAFFREAMDTKVRTKEDADAATAGMPMLGMIPRIRAAAGPNGNGRAAAGAGRFRRTDGEPGSEEQRLITLRSPQSPASEAFRAFRTNIIFAGVERAPQVLVMTSAMPGDGKSTSSANLAVTLAQQGTRTLLVDADMRKGLLHQVFGVRQNPGLTHVLLSRSSLDDAVQEVDLGDTEGSLHLLPSGVFPPNPAELIGSDRMRRLLAELRERYEAIVIDAPPLNLVTDAAILGTLADATVMVVRTGITEKRALNHAAAQLYHLRVPVGGVVLNDIDSQGNGGYYGQVYGGGFAAPHSGNGNGTRPRFDTADID
jgi:tyrosine-protein kinase Etk/Wzc